MIESSQAKSDFGVVLSMCDLTGNMVKPWAAAGYRCICVDLQHPDEPTTDGLITHVKADVRTWLPPLERYAAVFAFTPCTDLAVSGKGCSLPRVLEVSKPWLSQTPVNVSVSGLKPLGCLRIRCLCSVPIGANRTTLLTLTNMVVMGIPKIHTPKRRACGLAAAL